MAHDGPLFDIIQPKITNLHGYNMSRQKQAFAETSIT
jgi:hypothetical protein